MTAVLMHSHLWYRVADLRPRLLARARLHRHHFRGKLWYLLQDPASGRVHRFSPGARLLLAGMDGQRSVALIIEELRAAFGGAPLDDDVRNFMAQAQGNGWITL